MMGTLHPGALFDAGIKELGPLLSAMPHGKNMKRKMMFRSGDSTAALRQIRPIIVLHHYHHLRERNWSESRPVHSFY